MPFEVQTPKDLTSLRQVAREHGYTPNGTSSPSTVPRLLTVEEVMQLENSGSKMLVESLLKLQGLTLLSAPGKTGKTLLSAQIGMSVASFTALFDRYQVFQPGSVMFVEKDDPAGAASLKDIMERTTVPISGKPFHVVDTADAQELEFSPEFCAWLDAEIPRMGLRLVVLDSYTALRGIRTNAGDIVKAEAEDLKLLDDIAKHGTAILLLHHYSKGSASLDWSERSAGSFAMTQFRRTSSYDTILRAGQ